MFATMLHLRYYIIFIFGVQFMLVNAQDPCKIKIKGIVMDLHHEEEGLEYAHVYVEENNKGSQADEGGNFTIEGLCEGKYHLIISHIGCESKKIFINLAKDTTISIYLEHHTNLLEEISVSEIRSKAGVSLFQYTISGQTLNQLQGGDVAKIASYVPGVSMIKNGSGISKPIINGMSSNRIAIVNQGVPLESQQWGNDHAPEIDAFQSQSVSVIKGSGGVKYGVNAMSGIILLEAQSIGDDPHLHGDFISIYQTNGRGYSNNLKLERNTKYFKYRLSGNYKRKGDAFSPDYYLSNTGMNEINGSLYIVNPDIKSKWQRSIFTSYYKSNIGILRGAQVGSITDLQEAFSRKIPFNTKDDFTYKIENPRQDVGHLMIKHQSRFYLNDEVSYNLDLSYQNNARKEYDVRRGNRSDRPVLNMNLHNFWADGYVNIDKKHLKSQIGLQLKATQNTNISGTGVNPLVPNYGQQNYAIYGSTNTDIFNMKLEGGLRLEYQNLDAAFVQNGISSDEKHQGINYAISIGGLKKFHDKYQFKINIGSVRRNPFINELYSAGLHQGLASIEEGNRDLKDENSLKIITDHKLNIDEHSQINISAYYHRFNNYIYLQPLQEPRLTVRGAFPVFLYQQADVDLKGIDLMYNQELLHKVELVLKGSVIDAKNRFTNRPLVYVPPSMISLGINFKWNNTSKLKNVIANINTSYTDKKRNISLEDDLVPSPEAYTLINTSLSADAIIFGKETNWMLSVDNVLNTVYRDYLNRLRYFADEAGRNLTLKMKINL